MRLMGLWDAWHVRVSVIRSRRRISRIVGLSCSPSSFGLPQQSLNVLYTINTTSKTPNPTNFACH